MLHTGTLSCPSTSKRNRSLIAQAIEEALRWDGPVLVQTRMTTDDVTLDGVDVPAGSVLDVVAGAANRDLARFPDGDRFDIFRQRSGVRHFSFANGPHVCIGEHLARMDMTRALRRARGPSSN